MTWGTILEGERAERAAAALGDIAAALAAHDGGPRDAVDHAVFWSYMASHFEGDEEIAKHHAVAMDRYAERLVAGAPVEGLFGGATGLGWVASHVADVAEEVLEIVDRALERSLAVERWDRDYDLIGGLVGFGVYLLERPIEQVSTLLGRILDHLEATSSRDGELNWWHTAPHLLPPHQREMHPDGYRNCGLAHGIPGIVALCARIAELGGDARAVELGRGGARWLWAQRLPATAGSAFPAMAGGHGARTAWCYGDPGVTIALWRAERAFGTPERADEAARLALACLGRTVEAASVFDADICHGAMGLAHVATRFYHATRDERFRDAALVWIDRALDFKKPGVGIGGFQSYLSAFSGNPAQYHDSTAFLDGVAGVGLALLAALAPLEPLWDRQILCDLPVAE